MSYERAVDDQGTEGRSVRIKFDRLEKTGWRYEATVAVHVADEVGDDELERRLSALAEMADRVARPEVARRNALDGYGVAAAPVSLGSG